MPAPHPKTTFIAAGLLLFVAAACGDSDNETNGAGGATSSVGTGGSAGVGGAGGGVTASQNSSSTGFGGSFGTGGFTPTPVRELDGLESITFYERTGGTEPTSYTFLVNGAELTAKLPDPLSMSNRDIQGTSVEFYDVYYSDIDGEFDIDGSYLTISGVFGAALPAGGGLNLAEIGINYADAPVEYGNYLASYVVLGDNSNEGNVEACIDGDLQTHTTMGNTVNSDQRLRLTLGFASTSGPPK